MKKVSSLLLLVLISSFITLRATNISRKDSIKILSDKNVQLQMKLDSIEMPQNRSEKQRTGELTLLVSGVNNIIQTYGFILAFITVFFVSGGGLYVTWVNKLAKKRLSEIKEKEIEYDKRIIRISELENNLKFQDRYLERSIGYIYSALITLAEENNDKALLNKIFYDTQTIKLFSKDNNESFAALSFFSENGKMDIIEHLVFLSNNDSSDTHRRFASEVIGMIKERDKNSVEPKNNMKK